MIKRISISVSDEVFAKLQELKNELTGSRKISKVCQRALVAHTQEIQAELDRDREIRTSLMRNI